MITGQDGWVWVRKGGVRLNVLQESRGQDTDRVGGYLSPFCSLTPPSPALSVVPLLLVALLLLVVAAPPCSSSSVFTLLESGWSCSSPFCLLVGRDAEAEAWAARRWRGFATAGRENRGFIQKCYYCTECAKMIRPKIGRLIKWWN